MHAKEIRQAKRTEKSSSTLTKCKKHSIRTFKIMFSLIGDNTLHLKVSLEANNLFTGWQSMNYPTTLSSPNLNRHRAQTKREYSKYFKVTKFYRGFLKSWKTVNLTYSQSTSTFYWQFWKWNLVYASSKTALERCFSKYSTRWFKIETIRSCCRIAVNTLVIVRQKYSRFYILRDIKILHPQHLKSYRKYAPTQSKKS